MTCVIGLEHNDTVYVGADSAGIAGYEIATRVDEKIFTKEEFIMGFAGSFRMGQLLRYALNIPEQSARIDDMQYLVTDFMDAVRTCYRDKGFLTKSEEVESSPEGTFILGYHGKLYTIEEDFQVGRVAEEYVAMGCGSSIALGAMHACNLVDPIERITCALEAAAKFSAGVRGPFKIIKLKNGDCSD